MGRALKKLCTMPHAYLVFAWLLAAMVHQNLSGALAFSNGSIKFDAKKFNPGVYEGFGATNWPGDLSIRTLIDGIHLKLARLWVDYKALDTGNTVILPNATDADFDEIWQQFPSASVLESATLLQSYNVTMLLLIKRPPTPWLNATTKTVFPEYYGAYGRYWGAAVSYFLAQGVNISLIEIFNEPDGNWDSHVDPAGYNEVLNFVREDLDSRGLSSVGIVGPGVSKIDPSDSYVKAVAPSSLAGFSNHAYETNQTAIDDIKGYQWFRSAWAQEVATMRGVDPQKPIYVTEFATKAQIFHGLAWQNWIRPGGLNSRSDTDPYAARVAANFLELVGGGANGLFVWEAADQPWEDQTNLFGLLRSNGTKKSPYYALSALIKFIPLQSKVLKAQALDSDVSSSAFYDSSGMQLAVALANPANFTKSISVRVTNVELQSLKPTQVGLWSRGNEQNASFQVKFRRPVCFFSVQLPSDSVATLLFKTK